MRNHIIVGGAIVAAIIIGVFVFLFSDKTFSNASPSAVAESNPITPVEVPFTEIAHGTKSTVTTRANYLITSTSELEKLWTMIDAKGNSPTIDFTKNTVAAVFAGEKQTVGYTIAVSNIEDTNVRTVTVLISSPDDTCSEKSSVTAPYEIISLSATALPLAHEDSAATTSCSQN